MVHSKLDGIRGDTAIGWGVGEGGILGNLKAKLLNNFHKFSFSRWGGGGVGGGVEGGVVYSW